MKRRSAQTKRRFILVKRRFMFFAKNFVDCQVFNKTRLENDTKNATT